MESEIIAYVRDELFPIYSTTSWKNPQLFWPDVEGFERPIGNCKFSWVILNRDTVKYCTFSSNGCADQSVVVDMKDLNEYTRNIVNGQIGDKITTAATVLTNRKKAAKAKKKFNRLVSEITEVMYLC
jgi:hypothetical protein